MALVILDFSKPAAVNKIHKDIIPPIKIENTVSKPASFKSFFESHFSLTKAACRNILYGTTVVPIKPAMIRRLPSGILKKLEGDINSPKSTPTKKTVNMNEILIIRTREIKILSKNLLFPKKIIKNAINPVKIT